MKSEYAREQCKPPTLYEWELLLLLEARISLMMGTRSHYLMAESLLSCPPRTGDAANETGKEGETERGEWQLLSVFISYFANYHSLPQYISILWKTDFFFFCKKHFALGSRIVFFPPKSFSTSLSSSDSLVLILEFILITWFDGHEKIKLFKWRIRSETKCLIW